MLPCGALSCDRCFRACVLVIAVADFKATPHTDTYTYLPTYLLHWWKVDPRSIVLLLLLGAVVNRVFVAAIEKHRHGGC